MNGYEPGKTASRFVAAIRTAGWRGLIGLALVFAVAAAAEAGELVGHEAVYRLSLDSARRGSGISGAEGAVAYRFANVCTGWTVENRMLLRLHFASGGEVETDWTYTTWESRDGTRMRFDVRSRRNGIVTESLSGKATLKKGGGGGMARFDEPDGLEIPLPPGTLFPTAHLEALLRAAEEGRRVVSRMMFDGADVDGPYEYNAVILPLGTDGAVRRSSVLGALEKQPAWQFDMAAFPAGDPAETPRYELGVVYRADGIGADIRQDFDDFALRLRLDNLTILPDPDC